MLLCIIIKKGESHDPYLHCPHSTTRRVVGRTNPGNPSVNCQEKTRDELLDTLKITLGEILEINRKEAISLAENGYQAIAIQL